MERPEQHLIDCSNEAVQSYIEQLERDIATMRGTYLAMSDRLESVHSEYNELAAKLKATKQANLDQFAMAALPVARGEVETLSLGQIKKLCGMETDEEPIGVKHIHAVTVSFAYDYAELMQAESQKRRGEA